VIKMVTKKIIKYKALELNKNGKLEIVEKKLSTSKPYAKILYSGVCGTDKHAIQGLLKLKLPQVMGHENVGIVEGKRVTWPTILPCGKCDNCKQGMFNVCKKDLLLVLHAKQFWDGSDRCYLRSISLVYRFKFS